MDEIIRIKPIFDTHLYNSACDEKALRKVITEQEENTWYILGGDITDSVIVSDLKRYRKSIDGTKGDAIIDEQVKKAIEIFTPVKERILGIARGNHEDSILKHCGTDITQRMCDALGTLNLGYSGLFRLQLSQNGNRGRTIVIRYHHGWGGGSRTQGADLSKYSRDVAYWDADLFLYGHVHRLQTDTIPRLGLSGDKLISKPKLMCLCGTFLKTYTAGTEPTYSEVKGYPPVSVGTCTVEARVTNEWLKLRAFID